MKYLTEFVLFLMITAQNMDTLMERINGITIGSMVVPKSVKSVIKATIQDTSTNAGHYLEIVQLLISMGNVQIVQMDIILIKMDFVSQIANIVSNTDILIANIIGILNGLMDVEEFVKNANQDTIQIIIINVNNYQKTVQLQILMDNVLYVAKDMKLKMDYVQKIRKMITAHNMVIKILKENGHILMPQGMKEFVRNVMKDITQILIIIVSPYPKTAELLMLMDIV